MIARRRRSATTWVLGLAIAALAAAAGLARAGEPVHPRDPPPPAREPPAGADRVEILVRFPPWEFSGKFRIETASGAIVDEGVARDRGGFAGDGGVVERVLEGAKGTLTLRIQGASKTGSFPLMFGRWTLVAGSGAYAGISASGTFTSCANGEPKGGSPFELQTLLGHVVRR